MDGPRDTSDNDMSFELTGPAIIIPSKRSPKRDFATFSNGGQFRSSEQVNHTASTGDTGQQPPTIRHHGPGREQQEDTPSWMHWSFSQAVRAVTFTCAMLQSVYAATVMAAVAVAPAKRRLVSFAQRQPVPASARRLLWPRRQSPRLFRQTPSTSSGPCITTPISPPKFKPAASSPCHVPGRFPVSPAKSLGKMPVSPVTSPPDAAANDVIPPVSDRLDGTVSPKSYLDDTMLSENESVDDTVSLSSKPTAYASTWQGGSSCLPRSAHASVQELQNIREMFCRETELERRTATERVGPTSSSSPVLAQRGRRFTYLKDPTVMSTDEVVEPARSLSLPITAHDVPSTPLQNTEAIYAQKLVEPLHFSPPASTIGVAAGPSLERSMLTSPAGLVESPGLLSDAVIGQKRITSPLKSSMAKSGTIAASRSAHTPPSKGWMHQLVSSVKMKKAATPLRELYNGANGRQMKTSKSARFSENPVSATKRFVKNETITYPSPISSRDENSILSQASSLNILQMSPTQPEQDAMIASQLACSTPGINGCTTRSGCEPDISPIPIAKNDSPRSPHTPSRDGAGTSQELSVEDKSGEQMTPADNGRSASISSKSSDDHESSHNSPAESIPTGYLKATPAKAQDCSPSTPPSKLPEAFANLTVSGRRSSRRTQEKNELIAKRRREQEAIVAEEKARKAKAAAEEKARKQAEEEKERKKHARRMPIERVIQPLTEKWEDSVTAALAQPPSKKIATTIKGTDILRRDIGFVLPQQGTDDDPRGYLNDAIIEAYLLAIADRYNGRAGHKRGETPKVHAFNNFFYDNLKAHGPEKVKRWASRAKIGGKDLLKADWIFIPICESLHWTLLVVSGRQKTIEYFDSLNLNINKQISVVKTWIRSELGSGYKDDEWKVVEDPKFPGRGKGPHQNNGSDCGVFVITTAKMISLGVDPMAVFPTDMVTQRRRLVAELINGGFSGDFEPKIVFE